MSIIDLEKKLSEIQEEIAFFEQFFHQFKRNQPNSHKNIDFFDLFLALYVVNNKGLSFSVLEQTAEDYRPIIMNIPNNDLLINLVDKNVDSNKLNNLLDMIIKGNDEEKIFEYAGSEFSNTIIKTDLFNSVINSNLITRQDIKILVDFIQILKVFSFNHIVFLYRFNDLINNINDNNFIFDNEFISTVNKLNKTIKSKRYNDKALKRLYSRLISLDGLDICEIEHIWADLTNYYNKILIKENKMKKELKKENKRIAQLEMWSKNINDMNYIKLEKIRSLLIPDEESIRILLQIYNHNVGLDTALTRQYQIAKNDSLVKLYNLFENYNYSIYLLSLSEQQILQNNNFEVLDEKLKILNQLKYKQDNKLYYILTLITEEKLLEVKKYVNIGLDFNFVLEHFNILIDDNEFDNFISNIHLIMLYIPLLKFKVLDCLLYDNKVLKNLLKLSNQYDINLATNEQQILINYKLLDMIDQMIELNINDYNKYIYYLLSNPKLPLKIKLYQNIGLLTNSQLDMDIITNSNLIKNEYIELYLDNYVDYIKDNDSYQYLENSEKYEYNIDNAIVKQLDRFKINDKQYYFNGVYISRNKVIRNISVFNDINEEQLLNCIIYNSILTEEEYINICKCLNIKSKNKVL